MTLRWRVRLVFGENEMIIWVDDHLGQRELHTLDCAAGYRPEKRDDHLGLWDSGTLAGVRMISETDLKAGQNEQRVSLP